MIKITLDPGHGQGENKGISNGYFEGTEMFKFAYFLKEEIEKYDGVEVFVTRKNVTDNPELKNRGGLAVKNDSDLFLSLHTNAAADERAHGVSVFRSFKYQEAQSFGNALGQAVVNVMKNRGINTYLRGVFIRTYDEGNKTYDYYGVIRSSVKERLKYSYIIEHGFHTNKQECDFILLDENKKKIAASEAKEIAKFFGLKKKSEAEKDKEKDVIYTVQKGDTLSEIAKKYASSVKELSEYNSIKNPDLIIIGQKIRIPYKILPIKSGDIVRIKTEVDTYFPGGKKFNSWVRGYDYIIAQTTNSKGEKVYRNGSECVLLGEKIDRATGAVYAPINSWCAIDYLIKI